MSTEFGTEKKVVKTIVILQIIGASLGIGLGASSGAEIWKLIVVGFLMIVLTPCLTGILMWDTIHED